MDTLEVRGAAQHNLKNVDVVLPKNRLIVFTGVSGSGKSSLAFDTIFAEGQRRYVESLSTYARQFLGQLDKPRYASIRGLTPTIAVEQRAHALNPRSTVGTLTEIHDFLRLLFARTGSQHCTGCGRPVARQEPTQIARSILAMGEGVRVLLLAPLVAGRKGAHADVLRQAMRDGFVRARIDGTLVELTEDLALSRTERHSVQLVVDRLVLRADQQHRLVDSIETALRRGNGQLIAASVDGPELLFSERLHCAFCDRSFPDLTPALFSFNAPVGMCPDCQGLGTAQSVDLQRLVPDPARSLREGAVALWRGRAEADSGWTIDIIRGLADTFGFSLDTPWHDLAPEAQQVVLHGADRPIVVHWDRGARGKGQGQTHFEGAVPTLLRRYRETQSDAQRRYYASFMHAAPCAACGGERLRPEARAVHVSGHTLPALCRIPVRELDAALAGLDLPAAAAQIAAEVLVELRQRVRFLLDVGLDYLSLDRGAHTLSGGETQRIRLASQLGTELTGVTYVLDEPTVGLHARDGARLIATLKALRDQGNTVLVVEHDRDTIAQADHVVDFGPGAGQAGGHIVFSGTPADLRRCPESLTGAYLSGTRSIEHRATRRLPRGWLVVRGARARNLKNLTVSIPVGVLCVVTGVSGAGKSTLVNQVVLPAVQARLRRERADSTTHDGVDGLEQFDKVVCIDQSPIGRTPRSNPATYTGLFDGIRALFARCRESRTYGYSPARFSFNVKGGRCEHCRGDGVLRIEMQFLPSVYVTCPECAGRRFNEATLRVRYRGLSIADVLDLSVAEALDVFSAHRTLHRVLGTLRDVGLGYIRLGQPSTTLSGGEAQRIKLSRELAREDTGRTLYVLDEPTTGLHFEDTRRLLDVLQRLVDLGNSVLTIEHNLDMVRSADYVLDLGPEGGAGGGTLVVAGMPEEVARCGSSHTGRALAAPCPAAASAEAPLGRIDRPPPIS